MYWTMVCTSKESLFVKQYSFEIELYSPMDDTTVSVQRNQCHEDRGSTIVQDGQMAAFGLGEILRFMDDNRVSFYEINRIFASNLKM